MYRTEEIGKGCWVKGRSQWRLDSMISNPECYGKGQNSSRHSLYNDVRRDAERRAYHPHIPTTLPHFEPINIRSKLLLSVAHPAQLQLLSFPLPSNSCYTRDISPQSPPTLPFTPTGFSRHPLTAKKTSLLQSLARH